MPALPAAQGLYDPRYEHDACGVALRRRRCTASPAHDIVEQALTALRNLEHRGATGADPDTGDGAGILVQIPDAFLRAVVDFDAARRGAPTPSGIAFLPDRRRRARPPRSPAIEAHRRRGGPDASSAGATSRSTPDLVGADRPRRDAALPAAVRRRRRRGRGRRPRRSSGWRSACASGPSARRGVYFAVAVGPHHGLQGDAHDRPARAVLPRPVRPRGSPPRSAWSTRGSRPTRSRRWPLAHPYRFIAHNGEINTVQGNRNWMRARESQLASDLIPGDLQPALPDLHARRAATRPPSTRCSSCCTSAAARCRTRC